ncbi:hypothetical protein VB740_34750 [Nostoc sp. UHCC 0251]|nr:hypothetical protein [Nostoc sp. UHCC 0251]
MESSSYRCPGARMLVCEPPVPERSVPFASKLTLSNTQRTSSERAQRSSSSTIPPRRATRVIDTAIQNSRIKEFLSFLDLHYP